MKFSKITIMRVSSNNDLADLNQLLQVFGANLGLFNSRDKDKSCYRIFLSLLKNSKIGRDGLSSDDIASQTGLSRGTVVHHLNRLMDSGLVVHHKGFYFLAEDNLEDLISKVRSDINKSLDDLSKIGKLIDKHLSH